jgi:hypothetical protein
MKKTDWKFIINLLMFVDFCSLLAIGLLMAFVMPGRSGQAARYFLGLHRHEWGSIHLYLAYILTALVILHLAMGFPWIRNAIQTRFGGQWKRMAAVLGGTWAVLLFVCWLIALIN